jgi:release factor glutamine methyltransferase
MQALDLLEEAVRTLKAADALDHWQRHREEIEAEQLLAWVLGDVPDPLDEVAPPAERRFRRLVARHATGEPVAHIIGSTDFRGLELLTVPGVFVPRASSEFLALQAARRLHRRVLPTMVDLATGGGPVALAVAHEVPGARVFGTDLSRRAVRLARRNASRLGLQARFFFGDLFDPLPKRLAGGVHVVAIHPPYVAPSELETLPGEVRKWEPELALSGLSEDGLGIAARAVDEAPGWLTASGWLLVEVSPDHARDARRLLVRRGYRDVRSTADNDLRVTRVIVGRRPA